MIVDIAAIPSEKVVSEAIRLNRLLSGLADDDISLGRQHIPHVSLLIFEVAPTGIKPLAQKVGADFKTCPDAVEFGDVSQEERSGRVFWEAVGTGWQDMHRQALRIGSTFRSKETEHLWNKQTSRLDSRQKRYLSEYGSPYVLEYFRPHITLAKFVTKVDLSQIRVASVFRGIDRVQLFELDDRFRTIQGF